MHNFTSVSPFLAPTCFGYSPSSGSLQLNSLKLTAKKKIFYCCLNYKWNILVPIVHLLVIRDCNHSQCTDKIIRNSISYYKEIKMFRRIVSSLHVTPHFVPRCKHQAYWTLQSSRSAPQPPDTFHEYHPKGKKAYDIHKCDGWGGGGDKS
jgi:hypothetical protein